MFYKIINGLAQVPFEDAIIMHLYIISVLYYEIFLNTSDLILPRVWDPYQKYNRYKVERVQRRAGSFVKSMYFRIIP